MKKILSFATKYIFQNWFVPEAYHIWSSKTITAKTVKIKATWTPELAQDLQAFQGFNAEAELTALLTAQMAAEIDRQILRDIVGVQKHSKSIAKKRRYKDRKIYIREIEEWCDVKINSDKINAFI